MASPRIADCPASPNCVSSLAKDADHRVDPIPVDVSPDEVWTLLARALSEEPRTRIVEADKDAGYLHAEATSLVFRFVDDLEFQFSPEERLLHVRSASRVGYSDFGVNRGRVTRIRERLKTLGLWH